MNLSLRKIKSHHLKKRHPVMLYLLSFPTVHTSTVLKFYGKQSHMVLKRLSGHTERV